LEGGWSTCDAALDFFRRLWSFALEEGLKPGEPLAHGGHVLRWLVEGHPRADEMFHSGINFFTIEPDGRGNHRFVLVDEEGVSHAFSTLDALTGFEDHPLSKNVDREKPFAGIKG
jgi:hypothetical protein